LDFARLALFVGHRVYLPLLMKRRPAWRLTFGQPPGSDDRSVAWFLGS